MSNNGCGQLGAIQSRGTCWFYSILNGFILSEEGQKILYNKLKDFYDKLGPAEKAYFDDEFNAPCPMKNILKTKRIYFWKFVDQYLCFMSGPRAASLKGGKSAALLGGLSLEGTIAKRSQGGKGAFPQVEIGKILDHLGFAKDYYFKSSETSPKFHALRKPQFVVVRRNDSPAYMNEIPKGLLDDPNYELMCASLVIANTKADARKRHRWHAISGFVCGGRGYIYDSNQRKIFKCNWWNIADFKKVVNTEVALYYPYFKRGKVNVHVYAFAIFARKEFTKDIGVSCLLKSKTKTPHVFGINFTDPNLGKQLNSATYNYLKPAERAALKRKWARTEHRRPLYLNQAAYNSIINSAKNVATGNKTLRTLINSGYKIKDPKNYNEFLQKLRAKFQPAPVKTYTFTQVKAQLDPFTKSTLAMRKQKYSLVWRGVPMAQRKVLMHWRNKGEWLTNNAFENKAKPPIKRKPKMPSPVKNTSVLNAAKRVVNGLKTAKARKEYKRTRAINMSQNNWTALGRYIEEKNREAQKARAAKKSVAKK